MGNLLEEKRARVGKTGRSEGERKAEGVQVKGVARSEKWLFSHLKPSALWSGAMCVCVFVCHTHKMDIIISSGEFCKEERL